MVAATTTSSTKHLSTQGDGSFNRPPRVRPVIPERVVLLPAPPRQASAGRGGAILSSLLISGTMLAASYLVSQMQGTSPVFLLVTASTAVAFLVVSIGQWLAEMRQRWLEQRAYRQALRQSVAELIQLYANEQSIAHYLHPVLTSEQASQTAHQLRQELDDLIKAFVPYALAERIRQRLSGQRLQPEALGITLPPAHQPDKMPFLLAFAGYQEKTAADKWQPQPRLWERRPTDPDALMIRIGTARQPAVFKIDSRSQLDQHVELMKLSERFSTIEHQPITVSLLETGSLGLACPPQMRERCLHSIIWQLLVCHAPSDVRLVALYHPDQRETWRHLIRAPHFIPLNGDKSRRMFPISEEDVERSFRLLLDELGRRSEQKEDETVTAPLPYLVVIVDNDSRLHRHPVLHELLRRGKERGIFVLVLGEQWEALPSDCGAMMRIGDEHRAELALAGGPWSSPFRPLLAPEDPHHDLTGKLTRALIGFVDPMGSDRAIPRTVRLYDLLAQQMPEMDLARQWQSAPEGLWHPQVPIGVGEGKETLYLDLNENSDGPHGIIAGKTGAGKSELLQAIITALATTHSPQQVEFLLIDFKGGAALRIFADLPHTVGLVTDLADRRLAERAITALRSELRRRKKVLEAAGETVQNIKDYRRMRRQGEPLANLLIVIDEFDTMVKEQPAFLDELIAVVKQGRSLGVHLLVATQQPSLAVKDEIKSQLNYWLALRLGSVADSREMLQQPDAFFLPADIPGRAYKRVGTQLTLFQAARVSGPYQDDNSGSAVEELRSWAAPLVKTVASQLSIEQRRERDIDVLVKQIKETGKDYPRRNIWAPPLPARLALSQRLPEGFSILAPEVVQRLLRGEDNKVDIDYQHLRLPIAVCDIPQESKREPFVFDLTRGHVLIFGAPASGKTTLIQTILLTLGVLIPPTRLWCYVIGASTQGLSEFQQLPHVGGVVAVREAEKVRRVLAIIQQEIERRENHSDAAGVQSASRPDIVLIIDKFALFLSEYNDTELIDLLSDLVTRGLACGIHVIITADSPINIPYKLQGLFDQRWILRLTDEGDALSLTGRKDAARLPIDLAGRGYVLHDDHGWLETQFALPFIQTERRSPNSDETEQLWQKDAIEVDNLLNAEMADRMKAIISASRVYWERHCGNWSPAGPLKVISLPVRISFDQFRDRVLQRQVPPVKQSSLDRLEVFFGLESESLAPISFTLSAEQPAFLIGGNPGSGKTTALRTMIQSLALRYDPDEIEFALIGIQPRSFRNLALRHHQPSVGLNEEQIKGIADAIEQRLAIEKPTKSLIIAIDDYDKLYERFDKLFQRPYSTSPTTNMYTTLGKVLSEGREKGIHLIIAAKTANPSGLLGQISDMRYGFILQPHNFQSASDLLGVNLPIKIKGQPEIRGRGILVDQSRQQVVQVADCEAK